MSEVFIPLILTAAAFIAAFITYRGIRRGGARFYTLEREAMLRRASLTLLGTVLLFSGAVGLLIYDRQQLTLEETAVEGENAAEVATTPTPDSVIQQFPPTDTPIPTVDADIPTATPTQAICRAQITGTSGNGLTLRDTPGGAEIEVLPESSLVTMLADEPAEANGFSWRKVRIVGGSEGWVAADFLTFGAGCEP